MSHRCLEHLGRFLPVTPRLNFEPLSLLTARNRRTTRAIVLLLAVVSGGLLVAQDSERVAPGSAEPPTELEAIHSKAVVARERSDYAQADSLRLQRLDVIKSLSGDSAWKKGLEALGRAQGLLKKMRYSEASRELLQAWIPFDEHLREHPKAVVFGDLIMKLFEVDQAARAVYAESDPSFPSIRFPPSEPSDSDKPVLGLPDLVNIACESDPCQVEIRAARAFLISPEPNERFLSLTRRTSNARRNQDLLAISYPEKVVPIQPWHGPAAFLLGESSGYVLTDLTFMDFLEPVNSIRGVDGVGEAFQTVLGGAILCIGVSAEESRESGKSQVRYFVDDYRDGKWHRMRPYYLVVEPLAAEGKGEEWTLSDQDLKKRLETFEKLLTQMERTKNDPLSGSTDRATEQLTERSIGAELEKIATSFRGTQRMEVMRAIGMIMAGTSTQPSLDGTQPPIATSSLSERLSFLQKGFQDYAIAKPEASKAAMSAAARVGALVEALRATDDAVGPQPDGEANDDAEPKSFGGDLVQVMSPSQALQRLKRFDSLTEQLLDRVQELLANDVEEAAGLSQDCSALLHDYKLTLAARGLESLLYRRRDILPQAESNKRDDDFKKCFGDGYFIRQFQGGTGQQAPLRFTSSLFGKDEILESLLADIQGVAVDEAQTVAGALGQSAGARVARVEKDDMLALLELIQELFHQQRQLIQARNLREITVGRPRFMRWKTQTAEWSVFEMPNTIPQEQLAAFMDNALVPTISLKLAQLEKCADEQGPGQDEVMEAIREASLTRASALLHRTTETLSLDLKVSREQLPAVACLLIEHPLDQSTDNFLFRNEAKFVVGSPLKHHVTQDGAYLKSEFDGCDGYTRLGIGEGDRHIIDRLGNKITASRLDQPGPFQVVTSKGTDLSDAGADVVFGWDDWRKLDQNVVNEFLPDTVFYAPSLPAWSFYRSQLLRLPPLRGFRWGAARVGFYRLQSDEGSSGY